MERRALSEAQRLIHRRCLVVVATGVQPHHLVATDDCRVQQREAQPAAGALTLVAVRNEESHHLAHAVAQVSHVPHLVSVLMAGRLTELPPEHLRLAGQGVRDVTRIAGSDPQLWRQILLANAAGVRVELEELQADLARHTEALDDPARVAELLERGREGTRSLPGKHGLAPVDYANVVVEIPDAPGALARLFADIQTAGVNIEDLSIDHDLEREIGFLSVQVAPDRVPALQAAMSAAGWTLRDREPQL